MSTNDANDDIPALRAAHERAKDATSAAYATLASRTPDAANYRDLLRVCNDADKAEIAAAYALNVALARVSSRATRA